MLGLLRSEAGIHFFALYVAGTKSVQHLEAADGGLCLLRPRIEKAAGKDKAQLEL